MVNCRHVTAPGGSLSPILLLKCVCLYDEGVTSNRGAANMKHLAGIMIFAGLTTSTAAAEGPEALLDQARCGMCHQLENPMLGPSYKAIAERYRNQDGAVDEVFVRMREGSQGLWGQTPMPAVAEATLSDDELRAVVDWVLSQ